MRRIIKKVGSNRIGSGPKMTVQAHGYGYSTNDVSTTVTTQQGFGTVKPYGWFLLPPGSRLRMKMDAMVTSEALKYQLYGSAKIQWDVYEAPWDLYNSKLLINLQDQGYTMEDVKFPTMTLEARGFEDEENMCTRQINPSSLLAELGAMALGQKEGDPSGTVSRTMMAMFLIMYYQTGKEYYCNKQEGIGYMIHTEEYTKNITSVKIDPDNVTIPEYPTTITGQLLEELDVLIVDHTTDTTFNYDKVEVLVGGAWLKAKEVFKTWGTEVTGDYSYFTYPKDEYLEMQIASWRYTNTGTGETPFLVEYDLKAIDRMMQEIMKNVDQPTPVNINKNTELPFGACFRNDGEKFSINATQEGLIVGCYQSDINQNWLNNEKVNALSARTKVKVDAEGYFSIDQFNITQKLYNVDQRIAITDGSAQEWFELTYAIDAAGRVLKPIYVGGLAKEILFNMVISTAGTEQEPLGSIASRGTLGDKHKGGYVQIEGKNGKLVMILGKITPRLVYTQGIHWYMNLRSVDDIHKPGLDKIAYQNWLTDQFFAPDTIIKNDGTLITKSIGKLPAWTPYTTNVDRATCRMASTEAYKVFGRKYEAEMGPDGQYQLKDGTTYIDPTKFNNVFVDESLEAMPFDIVFGVEAYLTMVKSEEVIPGI